MSITKPVTGKPSTLYGIIFGFVAIFGAFMLEGGPMGTLFMLPAMLIVFGGTLAAGVAGTSLQQVLLIPKLMKIAFFPPKYDKEQILEQIVAFSAIARRQGFLSIEDQLYKVKHPFMKKLFQICVDGADSDSLHKIVDLEVQFISERHNANSQLFYKLGGYSPTMGIIGTVMGLISTLAAAGSDPSVLIRHIASAFIATMWGIFMANIVWLPLGDKLKTLHNEEMQILHFVLEGVNAVQIGEVPSVIRAKLVGAFPSEEQDAIMNRQKLIYQETTAEHKSKPEPMVIP